MIAVIQFKKMPGRRFKVLPAHKRFCGDMRGFTRCAFFQEECHKLNGGAPFAICRRGFFFEEIKE